MPLYQVRQSHLQENLGCRDLLQNWGAKTYVGTIGDLEFTA